MTTKLYRSRTDSVIAGVCGGLGQALDIDPVLIRLFFVLLALGGGAGLPIYVVLWIVMPLEGAGDFGSQETIQAGASEVAEQARAFGTSVGNTVRTPNTQTTMFIAAALIIAGTMFLLRNMGIPWLVWLQANTLWPLLLILGGITLLLRRAKGA